MRKKIRIKLVVFNMELCSLKLIMKMHLMQKTRKQKLMVSKNAYYARKTKCVNQLKQLLKSQSYLAIWYCY